MTRPDVPFTHPQKHVLYFGGPSSQFMELVSTLGKIGSHGHETSRARSAATRGAGPAVCWAAEASVPRVLRHLEREFVNLMVLDLRCAGDARDFKRQKSEVFQILTALDDVGDVESRYGFHRIMLLIAANDPEQADQAIIEVGQCGVGNVLRQPFLPGSGGAHATDATFAQRVSTRAHNLLFAPHRKRRALCAAGGGVTGIYFEIGALKCLDDCIPGAINSFDMYFGISAGAIVNGLLSAGYSVDELMAAVHGVEDRRLAPIDMRVFRLNHLDYPSMGWRVRVAAQTAWKTFWKTLKRPAFPSLDTLLFDYADMVGPPFRARGFGKMLEGALTNSGATNDFRRLPHALYIGATEQDTRRHVLFGADDYDDVPISAAIEASMSLNPAFSSTPIGEHFYEDGAVTRTSNFAEAIRRGADLVFTIDPFLPYVSRERGFSHRRGMLYNIDQNVRTMSYTRFDNTRNWVLRRHPDVSSYTFVPANHLRRLLSISPFDHRPYLEIWRGAYLSTLQRVQRIGHRLRGDLRVHGLDLDTSRAEAVAERLNSMERPRLEDFFANGTLEIKEPPLCLQAEHPSAA